MAKDYYKILGVARNSDKEEIKKAYRSLAHKYHPDKKGGDEIRFKEINEAYQILGDEKKRGQYDQFGTVFGEGGREGGFRWSGGPFNFNMGGEGGLGAFDFSDILEDFFGGGTGFERGFKQEKRGKDIAVDLEISFRESILGSKKNVSLRKLSRCPDCLGTGGEKGSKVVSCPKCQGKGHVQKIKKTFLGSFAQISTCPECLGGGSRPDTPCRQCNGRGVAYLEEKIEIMIPKSMRDGEILKVSGKGEASLGKGVPGDLYITVHVRPDGTFRRQEDNIIMALPLDILQATLGDIVEVETLDGKIKLKIPDGTQPGDILKIRGKGAWLRSGYERGDLLIETKVNVPRRLSKKAKEILNEFKKEI